MIDFHALYHQFMDKWIEKNSGKYVDDDEIADAIALAYEDWCNTSLPELNNISPRGYFDTFSNPEQLVNMMIEYFKINEDIPALLMDRITQIKGTVPFLVNLLKREKNDELTMYAVNILNEMDASEPYNLYIEWIFDIKQNNDLRDIATEVLSENYEQVADKILGKLDNADISSKIYAADILSNCKPDDRIYNLLIELFLSDINKQLYASYLGKYGDIRAIEPLTEVARSCDYIVFIEIRNAIEQLGGELKIERDFSFDSDYQKIKKANNVKKN